MTLAPDPAPDPAFEPAPEPAPDAGGDAGRDPAAAPEGDTDRRTKHLVSAAALHAELAAGRTPRLLDVRWRLTDPPGEGARRYARAHLPGARFLDLETVLTTHTGNPRDGRHPLPDPETLAAGMGAVGVGEHDDVVVYDEPGTFAAERAWWVLRWAGLAVRVLDGGIDAWLEAGGRVETGQPAPARVPPPRLRTGSLATIDADAAAAVAEANGLLLDARAPERYRGDVEPLDPRAGHIPGAVNAPAAALYTADGRMPSEEEVRAVVDAKGQLADGRPVGVYCGSGVSAARVILGLTVLGVDAALFPASWSGWSNDPARPVATGPDHAHPSLLGGGVSER